MEDIKDEIRVACIRKGLSFALIADKMELDPSTVSQWFRSGRRIPAEHVLMLEYLLDVPRYVLRPDIYPKRSRRQHA